MADDIIGRLYSEMQMEGGGIAVDHKSCKDLFDNSEKLRDKIRPHIDPAVMEELESSQSMLLACTNLEWFRRGVRTGMLLMLEII